VVAIAVGVSLEPDVYRPPPTTPVAPGSIRRAIEHMYEVRAGVRAKSSRRTNRCSNNLDMSRADTLFEQMFETGALLL